MSENGSTEQRRIKVEGLIFNAPAPYRAGHMLNENEANTLNQTFAENLRNNFAKKVKSCEGGRSEERRGISLPTAKRPLQDLQQEFSSYANDYEFGTRAAGGGGEGALPRDPVDREAYIMARDMIRQHAKSKGIKVDAEQVAGLDPRHSGQAAGDPRGSLSPRQCKNLHLPRGAGAAHPAARRSRLGLQPSGRGRAKPERGSNAHSPSIQYQGEPPFSHVSGPGFASWLHRSGLRCS